MSKDNDNILGAGNLPRRGVPASPAQPIMQEMPVAPAQPAASTQPSADPVAVPPVAPVQPVAPAQSVTAAQLSAAPASAQFDSFKFQGGYNSESVQQLQGVGKGLGVASLITGISSFVLIIFLPVFNLLFGLAGVVLGIVAGVKKQPKGLWITGIVFGGLAIVITLVGIFALAYYFVNNSDAIEELHKNGFITDETYRTFKEQLEQVNN
ncbi:hypothetical protein KJY77_04705 [Canibacter sp. lx-72]|uniref:DUF4190 domain-containing protein n=1 Tax=Canibacter zhuwentaonis TaxID=2837491 RepID=UPI001BDBB6F1|nr:DUF4190 domain-containing protein [Canibacter zhuwentaonis]MBT1018437.1 hypothetical protein [Canibacter zhuwentaonis]